jgi:Heparinase II/III-like protein/Heparinase II/III N-terminus
MRLLAPAKKLLALPPRDMLLRAGAQLAPYVTRAPAGAVEGRFRAADLLSAVDAPSLEVLHRRVVASAMPWAQAAPPAGALERFAPCERERLIASADTAVAGRLDLMGSGLIPITDGTGEIDWHKDYKSGHGWPFAYFHDLDASDLTRNSDVRFPWELSRLQWLLPVVQAWRLTGDSRYPLFARKIIDEWMTRNPYAWGINWACTMEPAMRAFTWCWIYTHLAEAPGWQDDGFRVRVLRALYLHLAFVRRFIEITDVNGNHMTADAAALVVGGTFFGGGRPKRWMATGWRLLEREIVRQVYADGVNFEGSIAYHRLVTELFHVAGAAWEGSGGRVPVIYRDRLLRMADYTEAYTRPDGLAPMIGDNDDARVLPLGDQPAADHRYLPPLIRRRWAADASTTGWEENAAECLWWWGAAPSDGSARRPHISRRFTDGGVCVLRSDQDYVFFACAPLGLAGRGGHSHNDLLSFEAVLDGCSLVVDAGCYVYTADMVERNRLRSTAVHNTPQIDDEEINRFISPSNLWFLHHDAYPVIHEWEDSHERTRVIAAHTGYQRLSDPVTVTRTLELDKLRHVLSWEDRFEARGAHRVRIPLQFHPQVRADQAQENVVHLLAGDRRFHLQWSGGAGWRLDVARGTFSPRYGVALDAPCLVWTRESHGHGGIKVVLQPSTD